MKRHIDWKHATGLVVGGLLCVLAVVLEQDLPEAPVWSWAVMGISGMLLTLFEIPEVLCPVAPGAAAGASDST